MLARWLTKLAKVTLATTAEERNAIYKFRYDVYVREFNVQRHPMADHQSESLSDHEDELETSSHLYTGSKDALTSSVRIRSWEPGMIPESVVEHYSMDIFPGLEELRVSEVSRMIVLPNLRGRMLYPSLLNAGFEHMASVHGTDLVFLYCLPGLVGHYLNQGARVYGAKMSALQTMVPLVIVMSDYERFKNKNSIVAPICKKYYGQGKNRVIDVESLSDVLDTSKLAVTFSRDKVREDVHSYVEEMEVAPQVFSDLSGNAINTLLRSGFVLNVKTDEIITNDGFMDKEVYVILTGKFEATTNERHLCFYQPGEAFGLPAFFSEDGLRGASVRANSDGKLLVLRRKFLCELTKKDPKAGFQLLMNLSRILSERLRLEFQRSTLTEKLAAYLIENKMDSDTETYSRSYMTERIAEELDRSQRYQRALSLVLVEVCEYDAFEAKVGPASGREALTQFARQISKVLRSTDIVGRFNRNCFVVLLVEVGNEKAGSAKKKLAEELEGLELSTQEGPVIFKARIASTSIEVGGPEITSDGMLETAFLQLKDAAQTTP